MSVRRKLFFLLGAVVLVFAAALFWLWTLDRDQFATVERDRLNEQKQSFERFLQYRGGSLETSVNDYTSRDDMVSAIKNNDRAWVDARFGSNAPGKPLAHAFWVYRPDKTLFFSRNGIYATGLEEVPIARAQFDQLFSKEKSAHFFAKTSAGILEVRGAPVYASRDTQRTGAPAGYFFAGRLWNDEELKEMSLLSGTNLSMVDLGYTANGLMLPHGAVAFTYPLSGVDGKPVGRVLVRYDAPLIEEANATRWRIWAWSILFTVTLVGALVFALRRWLWNPMNRLLQSLRGEDPTLVEKLNGDRTEVGELARFIRTFFEQRDALLREIRDRRQEEKALLEKEEQLLQSKMEAIGRLTGGIAHDFSNLFTVIIGYAGLLRERWAKRDTVSREDLDRILRAGDRAAALTRQLLAFSRKQMLHPQGIDLNDIVHKMEPVLRRITGEHIELRVSTEASQGGVHADRAQIEQVVLHLAGNARDAMPDGGILTISTTNTLIPEPVQRNGMNLPAGTYVTLEVTDTGTGMDEGTRERIFEPFFTTKPSGQGAGLGLASVFGIVQQSCGAIALTTAPGKGTSFLVHLPLVAEPEIMPELPRDVSPDFESAAPGNTILVIEPDDVVRELVCFVLQDQGYQVLSASDTDAARRIAEENREDIRLLLAEGVLPNSSGVEIAQELRQIHPGMEVLFIGGYADGAIEPTLLDADANVLEKPFTPRALLNHVSELIFRQVPVRPLESQAKVL
ncbi:ATP-binding protein [Verrucomicrobiota bacterium sgz303538]